MPREAYLVSAVPVDLEAVIRAAAEVDDTLGLRGLYDGAVLQLVGDDDRAVLTVESSRRLDDLADVARVTRGLTPPDDAAWWTEAMVPWGAVGDPGVAVLEALTDRLGGALKVEDGT